LRGDEIRGCWEAAVVPPEGPTTPVHRTPPAAPDVDLDRTPVRRLEFVEVGTTVAVTKSTGRRATPATRKRTGALDPVAVAASGASGGPARDGLEFDPAPAPAPNANQRDSGEPRWSLWGETEG